MTARPTQGKPPVLAAYVAVGSNIEPERNVLAAMELLGRAERITGVSTFYWTEPLADPAGPAESAAGRPRFLNGVWAVATQRLPAKFKRDVLAAIEQALGRTRGQDRYAPRTIDLDLLLAVDPAKMAEPAFFAPPEEFARPFVAVPLLELCPALVLPGAFRPVSSVADSMRAPDGRWPGMAPAEEFNRRMREALDGLETERRMG